MEEQFIYTGDPGTKKARVYDILNAGPRKRFTCSGVLVSNCYGASNKKLARMIGLGKDEVEPFFEAYHGALPFIRETMESISREIAQRGHSVTILGRKVMFNLWEPRYMHGSNNERNALPLDEAILRWGGSVVRAFLYKGLNYTVQGSAADLLKSAMLKCWKEGVYDVTGIPKGVIHDEQLMSVPDLSRTTIDAYRELKHVMETAIQFSVPIRVEGERGRSWGETSKIED